LLRIKHSGGISSPGYMCFGRRQTAGIVTGLVNPTQW